MSVDFVFQNPERRDEEAMWEFVVLVNSMKIDIRNLTKESKIYGIFIKLLKLLFCNIFTEEI